MGQDPHPSAVARSYATAHEVHYGSKDLRSALELYGDIMAAHPESVEAGYSRSQIRNIARAVIPKEELLAAQAALALSHLAKVETVKRAEGSSESAPSEPPDDARAAINEDRRRQTD